MPIQSLKKNNEFKKVYHCGQSAACRYMVLHIYPNDLTINRWGISVSRKVGGAVVRNRVKRRIKESCRLTEANVKQGYDIVIVARVVIGTLPFAAIFYEVNRSLLYLFKKLDLLN